MTSGPQPRLILPSLIAGPLVILFYLVEWWASQIPRPIELDPGALALLLVLPFSVVVGFPVALIATAVGSRLLIEVGQRWPLLRFPLIWPVTGGLSAYLVMTQVTDDLTTQLPFAATAAACAFLCRIRLAAQPSGEPQI